MLKVLKLELFKLKRSKVLLIATAFPIFAVILAGGDLLPLEKDIDIWDSLFRGSMQFFSALIFPLSITTILAMATRIEHSSNGWKQILSLPVEREEFYFAKLLTGVLIILYSVIIFFTGFVITGLGMGAGGPIPLNVVKTILFSCLSALPIIAIQFYLSFFFTHIGIPLAVGIGCSLPCILIANSEKYWIYYPWAYPIVAAGDYFKGYTNTDLLKGICPTVFVVIIIIGLIQFKIRDIL